MEYLCKEFGDTPTEDFLRGVAVAHNFTFKLIGRTGQGIFLKEKQTHLSETPTRKGGKRFHDSTVLLKKLFLETFCQPNPLSS